MDYTAFCNALSKCPTPAHYVKYASEKLLKNGFVEIREDEDWSSLPEKFFVVRDEREIIAVNKKNTRKGIIVCSNSDFTMFKTKPNTINENVGVDLVRVAPYGSGSWYTWLDRDLKVAGRLLYKDPTTNSIKTTTFQSDDPVAIIPTLAIHLNSPFPLNLEEHFSPIISLSSLSRNDSPIPEHLSKQSPCLVRLISQLTSIPLENILSFETSFIDAKKPSIFGVGKDMIASPGLSQLSGSILSLESFLKAEPSSTTNILAVFDNACIRSNLRCGANSDLLSRVISSFGNSSFLSRSKVIVTVPSVADNPNFDQNIRCVPGKGITLNYPLQQPGFFYQILRMSNIPFQEPSQRMNSVSLDFCIDNNLNVSPISIGVPILGLNSIRESCMLKDLDQLSSFLNNVFSL